MIAKSVERDPQNPRAWYSLGLLERAQGQLDAAREDFQKVAVILIPDDSVGTQYFSGVPRLAGAEILTRPSQHSSATIDLDPFHASAEYGLAQAEQHLGDAVGAKAHLERFQHITDEKLGKPIRFLYGEEGKYSLGQEMTVPAEAASAALFPSLSST